MAMTQHVKTTIRYDGPALRGHDMDVEDLAPALLALADIVQIANRKFNGDRAAMRVLVNADAEQKCFQLDLSLVQSLMDHAQTFLGKDNVTTAEQIAKIIGLAGGTTGSLFGLYKWLFGKKKEVPEGGISYTKNEATGTTVVNIYGDGNTVEVSNEVAVLASDPEVMKRAKTVLRPLTKKDYTDFTILHDDEPILQIDKEEAGGILAAPPPALVEGEDEAEGDVMRATGPAWVDTPHFRGSAKWTLLWSGQRVDAKMPEDFLREFQENETIVVPNTKLTVQMKVTTKIEESGLPGAVTFEVEEVLKIDLPPKAAKQLDMLDDI